MTSPEKIWTAGLIVIGDEILSGKRQDKHLPHLIEALRARGMELAWAEYLGDVPARILASLQRSMASDDIVFSFGGIGATAKWAQPAIKGNIKLALFHIQLA